MRIGQRVHWLVPCALLGGCRFAAAGCSSASVPVTIGSLTVPVAVPALEEGRTYRRICEWVNGGYDGYIQASCDGGSLTVDPSGCSPKGCPIGETSEVQVGNEAFTRLATNPGNMTHNAIASAPCRSLVPDFEGYIWLRCRLGQLEADASSCRPRLAGERSFWRVVNMDPLPGTWRIFEVGFYLHEDCTEPLTGTIVASSQQGLGKFGAKQLAFDGKPETAWSARCDSGCAPGVAWIGLVLPAPSDRVRCVTLLQSSVACCYSSRVRLEVWDGASWQMMQAWDVDGLPASNTKGASLVVPITCDTGKPKGIAVLHNCDGLPVVGLQVGDTCHAKCSEGYYGERQTFTCRANGQLSGNNPVCYHIVTWLRLGGFASISVGVLFVGCQYKFWCMYRKVQIAEEPDTILPGMRGRWLEKDGINLWQAMMAARNEDELRSAFAVYDQEEVMQKEKDSRSKGTVQRGAGNKGSPKGGSPRGAKGGRGGLRTGGSSPTGSASPRSPKGDHKGGDAKKEKAQKVEKSVTKNIQAKREATKDMQAPKAKREATKDMQAADGMGSPEEGPMLARPSQAKMQKKESRKAQYERVFLDGLCSPCEDPDISCIVLICPLCRIADTWHTIGDSPWFSYWRVFMMYVLCPCFWPILNFLGRLHVRRTFDIPLEPHRDFIIHCCCCCCCAPCALCQEARVVDAPTAYFKMRKRFRELKEEGVVV